MTARIPVRSGLPDEERSEDTLVIGAGPAGLCFAATLHANGKSVKVLEKSRGVGGRCATRRVEGQPVDHGLAFYHGDDREFLSALHSVESDPPTRWPRRVAGPGTPCQPRVFRPEQWRFAFAGGISTFPKHLARGVPLVLETRATRIELDGDRLAVVTASGLRHVARTVVLALPAGQASSLLRTVEPPASRDLAAAIRLLTGLSMVRCLTLMAGYPPGVPLPDWDVCYPADTEILQMISQDSAKRTERARPVFVFQGRPRWSLEHWDDPATAWTDNVMASARPLCGDWVTRPDWIDTQRWRHARLAGGEPLRAPLLIRLANGARIGVVGEAMAEGGGVQAAWLAGRRLAHRLIGDDQR